MFRCRMLTVVLLSVFLLLLVSDSEGYCFNRDLQTPQGAQRTSPSDTLFSRTGDIFRFQCKRGYHFVGNDSASFFVTCSSGGNWIKNFQGTVVYSQCSISLLSLLDIINILSTIVIDRPLRMSNADLLSVA